ncbi:hypothetical protein [Ahniella affigens]|uniref:hypothetical protein n=1 Tax=Ahniella affigens TaxID=2021234 RepID=UPI0014758AE9|nr:hypothetical protein [Ahniella affigens]
MSVGQAANMFNEDFEFPENRILSVQADTRAPPSVSGNGDFARQGMGRPGLNSDIQDTEGTLLIPIGAIVDLLSEHPLEVDELRDHLGSALRIYARRVRDRAEVALLQRGSDERWQHLGWNRVQSDVDIHWFARAVLIGPSVRYELDSAQIRLD